MQLKARIWISLFLLFGLSALSMTFAEWQLEHPFRFALFAGVAVTGSILRAMMPDLVGGMWSHQLFVVFGLLTLSVAETAVVGCCCLVIESVWRRTPRISPVEIYFSLSNLAVSIAVVSRFFQWLQPMGLPTWVLTLWAGVLFFCFNTFPWAALASLTESRPALAVWKERYFRELPAYLGAAMLAWLFHTIALAAGWETALLGLPTLFLLYRSYRLHIARIEDGKIHAEHLSILHMRTIEALALAIEAKDNTTSDHLRRVRVYAEGIGSRMGMNEDDLTALRAAAVLHDIGKLAVPEYIITKPGRLTPEEFERMKIHPIIGAEILEHVNFPYPVVPIVRAHHEKWNGSGYPYGLAGEDIPLGARILSTVDTLDALATDRQYRRALPLDVAMQRVEEEAGTAFDPAVVSVLKANYVELERLANEAKSTTLKLSLDLKIERGEAPGAGFENAREGETGLETELLQAVSNARRSLQQLVDTGVSVGEMTRDELFALFSVRLVSQIPCDAIVIWALSGDALEPAWIHGAESSFFSTLRIPVGGGLSGWVVENRKSVVNGNPGVESSYLNDPLRCVAMRSALSAPVERGGSAMGAVTLYRDGRDAFTQDDLRILQSVTPKLAAGLGRIAARPAEVPSSTQPAHWDSLKFLRHVADGVRRNTRLGTPMVVLVCSLEGADKLAAEELDAAMRRASALISEHVGDYEILCRIGRMEYAIVLPGGNARTLAARLTSLRQTLPDFEGASLAAGEAIFPVDGRTAEELFALAESRISGPVPVPGRSADAISSGWLQ